MLFVKHLHFSSINVTPALYNNVTTSRTWPIATSGVRQYTTILCRYTRSNIHLTFVYRTSISRWNAPDTVSNTNGMWVNWKSSWWAKKEKCNFVLIFLVHLDLPIYAISVHWQKYRCIAKGVDTIVHAWYRARIPDPHCVQRTIVLKTEKSSVLLRDEGKTVRPIPSGRIR